MSLTKLTGLLTLYLASGVYGFASQNHRLQRRIRAYPLCSLRNQNDSVSACPFSKAYPRYRIDFTLRKKQRKPDRAQNSFVSNLQTKWQRSKFDAHYKKSNAKWIEESSPVDIFTSLWKHVAILEEQQGESNCILGFPNDADGVVQRWIEIMEWQFNDDSGLPTAGSYPYIQATILSRDGESPTVVQLQCRNQSKISPEGVIHEVMETRTKAWVKRILVDLSICPFTKSVTKSGQGLGELGIPVGRIAYHSSSGSPTSVYRLMADTWEAISSMLKAGPSGKEGISSILLAAPHFDDDFDLWSGPIFAMLEGSVVACRAEKEIGVVCFHPKYATPDGSSFPGFGHMHSVPRLQKWIKETSGHDMDSELVAAGGAWQRRTPHATINVLRADQLEAAESRRSSGKMYTENIWKLVGEPDGIGSNKLASDLEREQQIGGVDTRSTEESVTKK